MILMKTAAVILLSVLVTPFKQKGEREFYLLFASGFDKGPITLKLNDTPILSNAILWRDTISGISKNISVHFKNDSLFIANEKLEIINKIPFTYKDKLKIEFMFFNKQHQFYPSLKKGKYLIIRKANDAVRLNQYKKPIELD